MSLLTAFQFIYCCFIYLFLAVHKAYATNGSRPVVKPNGPVKPSSLIRTDFLLLTSVVARTLTWQKVNGNITVECLLFIGQVRQPKRGYPLVIQETIYVLAVAIIN